MEVETNHRAWSFVPRGPVMLAKVHLKVEKELPLHLQLTHQNRMLREMGFILSKGRFRGIDMNSSSLPDGLQTLMVGG